ncbi:MAG: response regulator transcription factor, partial [Proteobacteria bacterium]
MNKLRILLCDDHPIVRAGLAAVIDLQDDMTVVGEAADGEEAVRLAADLEPDVIVMDVTMPKLSGADATAQIKAARPEARLLALTAHEDNGYVQLLLKAGASGYVLKRTAAEDLVRAIHAVARGGV